MAQQQCSKLFRKGFIILSKVSITSNILGRASFFSSASASSNSTSSSPKFPIPSYDGASRPVPKITVPSVRRDEAARDDSKKRHQREIAAALRPSYASQTPLLLRNLHSNCDAVHFWRSLDYWRAAVGEDTQAEVEVGGKSYNSGSRVTARFGDYLDYLALCIEREGDDEEERDRRRTALDDKVAYLAQNEIFPEVLGDVPIPSFCESGEYDVGEGKLYHAMLWMGPRNTVSALHFDPLDNLLMQVVGWKRVLLFPADNQLDKVNSKEEHDGRHGSNSLWWHYAGANGNQYNTSAVDIENPDHGQFPNFKALAPTPFECILGPGDGLYIPKKWWHHVRSLEMSVSANVWWR